VTVTLHRVEIEIWRAFCANPRSIKESGHIGSEHFLVQTKQVVWRIGLEPQLGPHRNSHPRITCCAGGEIEDSMWTPGMNLSRRAPSGNSEGREEGGRAAFHAGLHCGGVSITCR
jgi:hypothetical protein